MRKPTYNFEVMGDNGKVLRRCTQSCHNIGAQARTFDLLRKTPGAVAVEMTRANPKARSIRRRFEEPAVRVELTACALRMRCSTTELCWLDRPRGDRAASRKAGDYRSFLLRFKTSLQQKNVSVLVVVDELGVEGDRLAGLELSDELVRLRQEGHLLRIALDRARHDHRVDAAVPMVAGRAAEDRKEHVLVRMRGTDAAHPTTSHEWRVVELQLDTGAADVSQRLGAVRLDARVQHVTLGRQGHLSRFECGR